MFFPDGGSSEMTANAPTSGSGRSRCACRPVEAGRARSRRLPTHIRRQGALFPGVTDLDTPAVDRSNIRFRAVCCRGHSMDNDLRITLFSLNRNPVRIELVSVKSGDRLEKKRYGGRTAGHGGSRGFCQCIAVVITQLERDVSVRIARRVLQPESASRCDYLREQLLAVRLRRFQSSSRMGSGQGLQKMWVVESVRRSA